MAAQTPAPTSTSSNPERATSDVPKTKPATAKNPGRVASGKRLAESVKQKNKPKHRNPLQIQLQRQVQQILPQNNQATTATTQATSFLGLVV